MLPALKLGLSILPLAKGNLFWFNLLHSKSPVLENGSRRSAQNYRRFLGDFEFFYRLISTAHRARTYLRTRTQPPAVLVLDFVPRTHRSSSLRLAFLKTGSRVRVRVPFH